MRKRICGDVTVNAISGTHVVFFAFDMAKTETRDLMGFAIQREDLTEREISWLRGCKTFPSIRKSTAYDDVSSHDFPFQAFQWADYTAKPGYRYIYKIYPKFGKPGNLRDGNPTKIPIETEIAESHKHSIYFNRGAIASQAYSKRFGPNSPEIVGPYALEWLARDLLPGMLNYINRAKDATYGLYGAIYEMRLPVVLTALSDARKRGAKVYIVYDATPNRETTEDNDQVIDTAHIRSLCIRRKKAKIMHNKFIVLTKNKKPVAVWTGSTNLSPNAFYGQLNVGHAIEDEFVAKTFFNYWTKLKSDPSPDSMKDWNGNNNQIPPANINNNLIEVFSPHRGKSIFDWYRRIAESAQGALFMTFPFGIVTEFRPVFDRNDQVLRYALLEKYVNGGNAASRKAAIQDSIRIRRLPNVGMAVGSRIYVDTIDGWLREAKGIGKFVNWVHTKFMLVDPLGNNPITITGSANWSMPSTNENDENMIVICGDQRVADIYFTEFMRIFSHHRFRESVCRHLEMHGPGVEWKPQDLKEKTEEWLPIHYKSGSEHSLRRAYFSG